jgi:Na+/H+ antiporter 1
LRRLTCFIFAYVLALAKSDQTHAIFARPVGQTHRAQRGTIVASQDSKIDLYGGLALGAATVVALILANSPVASQYEDLLQATGEIRIGSLALSKTLEHWINDGLMAVFFLLMGLEIKREVMERELASLKGALLPAIAALGGFAVPALIYGIINWNNASALSGWAIPCATDIAFVLGICALLGRAVPRALKTFLLALAIIDDLLAIIVIAVFYTDKLAAMARMCGGRRSRTCHIEPLRCAFSGRLHHCGGNYLDCRPEIGRPRHACGSCRWFRHSNDAA